MKRLHRILVQPVGFGNWYDSVIVASAIAAGIVFLLVSQASAEWGLYVSRNGKPWVMEQTFAFETTGGVKGGGCKYAAADVWRAEGPGKGAVTGITCAEYSTTVYANRGPASSGQQQWAPPKDSEFTVQRCAGNGSCINDTYRAESDGSKVTVTNERSYTAGKGDGSGMAPGTTTKPFNAGSISGTYRGSR